MRRAAAVLCVLIAVSLLMMGCTAAGNLSPTVLDAAALAELESWGLRGRVALNREGRGAQANVLWRQEGPLAQLELSGPWGVGAERVRIEGGEVDLFSEGDWVSMCAPGMQIDELQMLCDSAPLKSLPYWLRGLPDPDSTFTEYGSGQGAAREFRQDGWRIEVNALSRSGDLAVPRRLNISGPGASMRVAITNWELPPVRRSGRF